MNTVCPEILTQIFSYLELKDLVCAGAVSKEWNEIQSMDPRWKRFCLNYLDEAKPYHDSWKERFKIIQHWRQGNFKTKSYDSSIDSEDWGLVENDNTFYNVFNLDFENYFIYNRNTGEKIKLFSYEGFPEHFLFDKTWVVIKRKKILLFDILERKCIKKIDIKKRNCLNRKINCNKNELTVIDRNKNNNNKTKIWNVHTGELNQTIKLKNIGRICKIFTTPNFIICEAFKNNGYKIYREYKSKKHIIIYNRINLKIEKIFKKIDNGCITSNDFYMAALKCNGKIIIFKDNENSLELTCLDGFSDIPSLKGTGSIQIYQNWLLASKGGELRVWNINTKEQISQIRHNKESIQFCTNGIQLVMREQFTTFFSPEYRYTRYYTCYDFSGKDEKKFETLMRMINSSISFFSKYLSQ